MARDRGGSTPTEPSGGVIAFGPFRLRPAEQLLVEGTRPVRLGSRALDILLALVERPGELVSKDELIARVWPETVVEEVNLRVHVSALRRALGDGQGGRRYLATIPGRGYQFVCPVSNGEDQASSTGTVAESARDPHDMAPEPAPAQDQRHSLPLPLARMIGRTEITGAILAQLPQRRFVTIVGPGGIGKTTVAVAVADGLLSAYADGIFFVDLASVADPSLAGRHRGPGPRPIELFRRPSARHRGRPPAQALAAGPRQLRAGGRERRRPGRANAEGCGGRAYPGHQP